MILGMIALTLFALVVITIYFLDDLNEGDF